MVPPGIRNLYRVGDTVSDAKGVGCQGIAHASLRLMDQLFPSG